MASSSNIAHDHHMGEPTLFDSFVFENIGLMPLSGDFIDVDDVDFIGYLALGLGPTLYPLYCRTMLHDDLRSHISLYAYVLTSVVHRSTLETEESNEVPVYVNSLDSVVERLNFPAKSTRRGPDNRFYVVYDFVGSDNSTTVVHPARYPTGYHPWSDIDFTAFMTMPDVYDGGGPAIITNGGITSATVMLSDTTQAHGLNDAFMTGTHNGDSYMINGDLTSIHTSQAAMSTSPTIYSWFTYSANMMDTAHQSHADHKSTRTISKGQKAKQKAKSQGGLKRVMGAYPIWKVALAHLRAMLRVAICLGETNNPHTLNFDGRAEVIRNVWPQALLRANISVGQLEEVASLTGNIPMSHEDVLTLGNPSISEFMYDIKRLAFHTIGHPHGGFGLDDVPAGVLLTDTVNGLLLKFTRPKSNMLPIQDNGFAWFLSQQIAKEIMWHVVFRPTSTHGVKLVLANLESDKFRNVDHPPYATMSLLGSCCYSALLHKYSTLTNIPVELLTQYPTSALVHEQLCETAVQLVDERNDQDYPILMASLFKLCDIIVTEVNRLGRTSSIEATPYT